MKKVNVTDFFKTRTGEYVPDYAKRILNLFSLIHLSEITFSRLKINKNKYRSCLAKDNLENLRITVPIKPAETCW